MFSARNKGKYFVPKNKKPKGQNLFPNIIFLC